MNLQRNFGFVTINGETLPVKFGTNQTQTFLELENKNIKYYNSLFEAREDIAPDGEKTYSNRLSRQECTISEMKSLVFSALKDGARVNKTELSYSLEDVGDLIDSMTAANFADFFRIMRPESEQEKESESPNGKAAKKAPATANA